MDAHWSHSTNLSNRYFTFSKTIIPVVSQARIFIHGGLTNSPIFLRSLVNNTNGITANESCKLNTTWLNTSKLPIASLCFVGSLA